MKKSVYSLMLFDEIVDQIDKIADENNMNRSQLVNDVLAQYLGLMTPEQKIQRVLENLNRNFQDILSVSQINQSSSIHFGKSLKYKYRPKIKFIYEFTGTNEQKYAVLKISSRTKSDELNQLFDSFFSIIKELESKNHYNNCTQIRSDSNHKFIRSFKVEGSIKRDIQEITRFLTDYLTMVDQAMNIFFSKNEIDKTKEIQKIYNNYFMSTQLELSQDKPLDLVRKDFILRSSANGYE